MSAELLGAAFKATMPTHAAKLVLLKLVDEARDDGSRCYPSVARIAAAAQCSRRHVQRLLRKFQKVGLLTLDAEGGAGRGDTSEYSLNLDVLNAIGKIGWKAAIGVCEDDSDDDGESHKEDGGEQGESEEKSVTVSPLEKRATSEALKGDIGDSEGRHQESPNPLRDPLTTPEERRGRAGEDSKRRPFRELLAEYPDAAVDDLPKSERLYDRLSDPAHDAMWAKLPGFRDFLKGQRRRPPLQDFLRDRLWDLVRAADAPAAVDDGRIFVKPYSRASWALLWRFDAAGKSPIDVINNIGLSGFRFSATVVPSEDDQKRLVQIAVQSDEFESWKVYAITRWPELRLRFPQPTIAEFAWVPTRWPPEPIDDLAAVAEQSLSR